VSTTMKECGAIELQRVGGNGNNVKRGDAAAAKDKRNSVKARGDHIKNKKHWSPLNAIDTVSIQNMITGCLKR